MIFDKLRPGKLRRLSVVALCCLCCMAYSVPGILAEGQDKDVEDKLQTRVDLDYKDADIISVLRSLSWTYDLNIVTSPDIKGKVTITLKDVSVEKALEAIVTVTGLTYSVRDNIIYISPGSDDIVELKSEVIFLKYLKAADAQQMMRRSLSAKGDIKIDEVANSFIIVDYAANIQKVRDLLKKVDVAPKQVLIEAKIIDVTSSDIEALGITWNMEYAPGHGIFSRNTITHEELDVGITLGEQSSDLTGGQLLLNMLDLKQIDVTATLDALIRDGKANLLASPSIAVLNGQEARIVIGERYPYKERTQTATGTTETTKFVDIGTTLKVTPHINDDGYITMRVHPEVSSLQEALDAGPRITTREADTTVRIKQGETLVIGGLIKQQDDKSVDKIPYLGDIPLIGGLFARSETDSEQKELAVFITPKILLSREEEAALGKKETKVQEVVVNIQKTGELNLAESLFRKARMLDEGEGIESIRKAEPFRKTQALSIYENIYYEHPDSIRAP
ncbi:MAG: secretin and TonB N-terminal domain-containing protein, partial [Candidatus Omnitrophica bacterium]|nr:secretin and TonB N-terminal domain-containing protein [Candidatus Omnitrophota bacterium]